MSEINNSGNGGRILITGGAGYIGSHTAVELLMAGYEVVIADNFSNSLQGVISRITQITGKDVPYVVADCCLPYQMKKVFEQFPDIHAVIHFAALKAVGESVDDPLKYYHNNLLSLITLLQTMEGFQVKNLVFSSSCTVYGQPEELPVSETTPFRAAESPYGQTKQIGEQILRDTLKRGFLSAISLRYFNPIGAHDSALIGEIPLGKPNNLVPMITQTAAGLRDKLMVYGNDYNTPDGSCIRDYIHVVDVAIAHVKAIEKLVQSEPKKELLVYNLGTGSGYSVLETIRVFESVSKTRLRYEIGSRRSGDVEMVYADTSLANRELGWHAQRSLKDMLSSAWKWQLELKNNPITE